MSEKSASPAPRVRTNDDEFFQALLDACVEGIENFPVDKQRRSSATVHPPNNNNNTTTYSLISSPPTPRHVTTAPLAHSSPIDAAMNRAPLHGAPVRGQAPPSRGPPRSAPPSYSTQDARGAQPAYGNQGSRGNLAVQPAATTGSFKLKKAAVKILGAASFTATSPAPSSSPVPGPVKAKPKEAEHQEPAKPAAKPASPAVAPAPVPGEESALDDLFARLNTQGASKHPNDVKAAPPSRPQSGMFSFGDHLSALHDPTKAMNFKGMSITDATVGSRASISSTTASSQAGETDQPTRVPKKEEIKNMVTDQDISHADMEQLYLRKAADYLEALPSGKNVSVQTIKAVSTKLRSSYAVKAKLSGEEVEKLKARYAFAIQTYVKQVFKKNTKPITSEVIKKILDVADGDLLRVCARLVEEDYMSLEDMDNIAGLCKMIHHILPKPDATTATSNNELTTPSAVVRKPLELVPAQVTEATTTPLMSKNEPSTTAPADRKPLGLVPAPKDLLEGLKAWPTQEKRDTPPAHRSCILKGVSSVKNINQLQALVWGGRLESISMPTPGSSFALVRFLEPEACDKYFKATENGIEIQDDMNALVFVEKQAGPTSINDTIRNCTDGDVSRCVRALDVDDDDWNDVMLMKIARGKGALKREVDTIKRGKTARGRTYIEFRFASIYHALNFKRELHDDADWEACTINYATDPCETAQGVHYKDADESGAGFFA